MWFNVLWYFLQTHGQHWLKQLFTLWKNLSYSTSKLDQASDSPPHFKNRSLRCKVTNLSHNCRCKEDSPAADANRWHLNHLKFYCTAYKYSFYRYFYSALTKISQVSNTKSSIYLKNTYIINLAFKQMGRNLHFITWVYEKMRVLFEKKKIKLWKNSILW